MPLDRGQEVGASVTLPASKTPSTPEPCRTSIGPRSHGCGSAVLAEVSRKRPGWRALARNPNWAGVTTGGRPLQREDEVGGHGVAVALAHEGVVVDPVGQRGHGQLGDVGEPGPLLGPNAGGPATRRAKAASSPWRTSWARASRARAIARRRPAGRGRVLGRVGAGAAAQARRQQCCGEEEAGLCRLLHIDGRTTVGERGHVLHDAEREGLGVRPIRSRIAPRLAWSRNSCGMPCRRNGCGRRPRSASGAGRRRSHPSRRCPPG